MPDGSLSIEQLVAILKQTDPSSRIFQGMMGVLDSHLGGGARRLPTATPRSRKPLLTIGMAAFNDWDGVYFSVQALRLYHPEIADVTKILVIDNNPLGPSAPPLKRLEDRVAGFRYFPYDSFHGTTVKDLLFREASGAFVLVMDSHVLFPPGSLARLVDFLEHQNESRDLWQGPLLSDSLRPLSTHFDSTWSNGMHGQWAWDERAADADAPPFEIPKQGMGVFACRKEAWPGFNPRFRGFCCEEGYIHEKIRRNGGRTLCLPFLRWLHRFERPAGVPYRPIWEDRIRNFLIGYDELGIDPAPMIAHIEQEAGENALQMVAATQREIAGPYHQYDAIFGICNDAAPYELATGSRVRRIVAPEIPQFPEVGRVLAHREIIAEALWQKLTNLLVLEGDPIRGVAYQAKDFERLISEVPDTASTVALWLRKQGNLERFGRVIRVG
jgi:hypothetical protein